MIEAPSILPRLTNWRRATAFAGLVALALLHVSATAHQFEHSAEHDFGVCESCGAYSLLEDTLPCPPSNAFLIAPDAATDLPRADAIEAPVGIIYKSRAPPLS